MKGPLKKKLQNLNTEIAAEITAIITRQENGQIDLTDSCKPPTIRTTGYDGEDTFIADRIRMRNGTVLVESSSAYDSRTDTLSSLSCDTLVGILEFLESYTKLLRPKIG